MVTKGYDAPCYFDPSTSWHGCLRRSGWLLLPTIRGPTTDIHSWVDWTRISGKLWRILWSWLVAVCKQKMATILMCKRCRRTTQIYSCNSSRETRKPVNEVCNPRLHLKRGRCYVHSSKVWRSGCRRWCRTMACWPGSILRGVKTPIVLLLCKIWVSATAGWRSWIMCWILRNMLMHAAHFLRFAAGSSANNEIAQSKL